MREHQKPCIKTKNVIYEIKPVKNLNKNLQSFLEISPEQKELPPSHILQNHAYENLSDLKKITPHRETGRIN